MKYKHFRAIVLIFVLAFVINLVPKVVFADVNDFKFSSFEADYYLSKDAEGRSTMKVVEQFKAVFPEIDQNHGLARVIPLSYDGHSVSFNLESVKHSGLTDPSYKSYNSNGNVVIEVRSDDFIHGEHGYEFTYTLRDVTKTFGDHQELYWDTIGNGWQQTFGSVKARVHLDDSIASNFTGQTACYEGATGSKESCTVNKIDDKTIYFTANRSLLGYEGLTFVLGFKANSFAGYQMGLMEAIAMYSIIFATTVGLMTIFYLRFKYGRNYKGRDTIVPEYLLPKNKSVMLSADIIGIQQKSMTAQIIDLAVRHKIRILEKDKKFIFISSKGYELELLDIEGLRDEEKDLIQILFGSLNVGEKYEFSRSDQTRAMEISKLARSFKKKIATMGYREKHKGADILNKILLILLMTLPFFLIIFYENVLSIICLLTVIIAFVVYAIISTRGAKFNIFDIRPLTESGRELFDYLKGLKMYIGLAEADRLRYLQSPEGALKEKINTEDNAVMIKLYERLLPYAVLFGQEKGWSKRLGEYYSNSNVVPVWYVGTSGFDISNFSSSISSFSSYANSSSTSGLSGGGSSGGGGGGGGGGGL